MWNVLILGQLDELLLALPVVRDGVVWLGDADLRIRPHALLASDEERAHPRQVGLVGDQHQVEHEVGVLLEVGRNAGRLRHLRQPRDSLCDSAIWNAPLDVPHGVEVAGQLRAVAAAELPPEVDDSPG